MLHSLTKNIYIWWLLDICIPRAVCRLSIYHNSPTPDTRPTFTCPFQPNSTLIKQTCVFRFRTRFSIPSLLPVLKVYCLKSLLPCVNRNEIASRALSARIWRLVFYFIRSVTRPRLLLFWSDSHSAGLELLGLICFERTSCVCARNLLARLQNVRKVADKARFIMFVV